MKGYTHLTREQREAILASYQRTHSTQLTAQELNLPARRVADAVRRAGLALSGRRGVCYQRQDELRQYAAEGLSLSEIARRLGTTHSRVSEFLRDYGVPYAGFQQSGQNNPAWRGGRMTDKHGYILIHQPEHPHANRHGYVREHRLVMERQLGRYLLRSEVVHHQDGNRANNAPENLEVFGSNGDHLSQTLKGQVPKWTPEGRARSLAGARRENDRRRGHRPDWTPEAWERIRAGARHGRARQRLASQKVSTPDGQPS